MKNKGSWILALVTISVVAYAYFFEFKKRRSDDEQKEQAELIIKFPQADISKVILTNKEKIILEKKDSSWKIVAPVLDDADKIQVDGLLELLLQEKAEMEIGDDLQDAKIYGLDKPVASIEVTSTNGQAKLVSVGGEAIQGKNYLRIGNDKAVIVSSSQWKILTEKTSKDFRSKQIYRGGDIHTLEVEAPGQPKMVLKLQDGKWSLEGAKFNLDIPAIKAFVSQVENLHATDFASETQSNLGKFGLDKPAVVVRIVGKDNKDPATLRVSAPQNGSKDSFIVSNQLKPVFKSYGGLAATFLKRPANFRDREEPFQYTLAEVIGVRTKASQFDYRFIKKGEAWYLEKPEEKQDVDQNALMSLLTALQGARVSEYLGKVPFTPLRTIDLLDKEGNSLLKVEVGDEIKGKSRRLAKTSKVDEVFSLDSTLVDAWPGQGLVKEKAK
jgi:hypothetical protein